MSPKHKIIFDTDGGGDDTIALLLLLAAAPEDVEVVLITTVWGNVNVEKALRNVVALFYVLHHEMQWRKGQGRDPGFESLRVHKPIVSLGCGHALGKDVVPKDDGFHGPDGLHHFHTLHPELTPDESWKSLFEEDASNKTAGSKWTQHFTPSKEPAHREIIRVLQENPADTITVFTVGPMTNAALAASEDPEAFLRMKELIVMGGAVRVPGNITPFAEANTWNDAIACARVFALSSPDPKSTMPPETDDRSMLGPYPPQLSRQLRIILFPMDVTLSHKVDFPRLQQALKPQLENKGPLATLVHTFLSGIYGTVTRTYGSDPSVSQLTIHDGVTTWYITTDDNPAWKLESEEPKDIRVETSGRWTYGMNLVDDRGRLRADGVTQTEIPGDDEGWLSAARGNRIYEMASSPGTQAYHDTIMNQLFGE